MRLNNRNYIFSLFIIFSIIYILFFTKSWECVVGNIYTHDDNAYVGYTISIVNDFDVDITNHKLILGNCYINGRNIYNAPIGTSLLLTPFYAIAKPLAIFTSYIRNYQFNEKDPLFFVVLCSAVFLYFYIGSVFLKKALRYFYNETISALSTIVSVWGSVLPVYVFRRPIFTCVPEFLWGSVLLFIFAKCYSKQGIKLGDVIALGIISGFIIVTRWNNIHLIVFAAFAICYLTIKTKPENGFSNLRKLFGFGSIYLIIFFLFFVLTQGQVWKQVCGGYLSYPIIWYEQYQPLKSLKTFSYIDTSQSYLYMIRLFIKNFLHIIFGLDWGIIYTMPSIFIGSIVFIFKSPFKLFRNNLLCYTINFVIMVFPILLILRWGEGGEFYGYRYLLNLLPFSAFGFAHVLKKLVRYGEKLIIILCLLICLANFIIILPFQITEETNLYSNNISPLGHIGWGNNAYVKNAIKFYFINDKKTLFSALVRGYLGAYCFGGLSLFDINLNKYSQRIGGYYTLNDYKRWISLLYPILCIMFIFIANRLLKRINITE